MIIQITFGWDSDCPDCSAFRLDPQSGLITAAQTFDRITKAAYQLKVIAQDGADSVIPGIDGPNIGMYISNISPIQIILLEHHFAVIGQNGPITGNVALVLICLY